MFSLFLNGPKIPHAQPGPSSNKKKSREWVSYVESEYFPHACKNTMLSENEKKIQVLAAPDFCQLEKEKKMHDMLRSAPLPSLGQVGTLSVEYALSC
jgi:hypothetical protein